ncbi:MAG: hypothetical protein M3Q00_02495 [Pseudomonadota bacterium]|nr:hypothetical protein [Pseudomonadota bacterium]
MSIAASQPQFMCDTSCPSRGALAGDIADIGLVLRERIAKFAGEIRLLIESMNAAARAGVVRTAARLPR